MDEAEPLQRHALGRRWESRASLREHPACSSEEREVNINDLRPMDEMERLRSMNSRVLQEPG